jgi:hypothetical protein
MGRLVVHHLAFVSLLGVRCGQTIWEGVRNEILGTSVWMSKPHQNKTGILDSRERNMAASGPMLGRNLEIGS